MKSSGLAAFVALMLLCSAMGVNLGLAIGYKIWGA